LGQGDLTRKVKKFFERYGYDLSVTRLREIMATHIEDSSGALSNEGQNFLFFSPDICYTEYSALVETSQTHHRSVHQMYYVKKRRVVEDAVVIPEAISRITTNPMVNFEIDASNRYEEILQQQQQLYEQQQQQEDALLAVDPEVIPQRLYGRGRDDYSIKAKRYAWIKEEIEYFHKYFRSVEPFLNEEQLKQKYATCLAHIREQGDEVVQYFHPHHLENSDRIKTGYLKARETYRG
jgi:hypothetical protein